jgi:pyrimidine-nucleoside phosphorylase
VVPMISGRGLGHTGGTLDKLEAIPGFRVDLSTNQFRGQLRRLGVSMIGQTERLAPADRRLYALRDVTGTVESIPLIASSIMSKKLAEGIDALVLDVKFGLGAFMKTDTQARELARTLVAIGRAAGKKVTAFLTDMNQPLGRFVGNALEVREAIAQLGGAGEPAPDVRELVLRLSGEMLVLAGAAEDLAAAQQKMEQAIASGEALERLAAMVEAQGGDPRAVLEPSQALPAAPGRLDVMAPRGGVVRSIDAEAVGWAALVLGAGRTRKEDPVDPAVGVELFAKIGDPIEAGAPLAALHHRNERGLEDARQRLAGAYLIGDDMDTMPARRSLVLEVLR